VFEHPGFGYTAEQGRSHPNTAKGAKKISGGAKHLSLFLKLEVEK